MFSPADPHANVGGLAGRRSTASCRGGRDGPLNRLGPGLALPPATLSLSPTPVAALWAQPQGSQHELLGLAYLARKGQMCEMQTQESLLLHGTKKHPSNNNK